MLNETRTLTSGGKVIPHDLTEALIRAVVYEFYDDIRADELLAPIFNDRIPEKLWGVHLDKMCDFWSSSLLRSGRYEGRPLPPHLNIAELSDEHFERWLTLFHKTVHRLCSPEVAEIFFSLARRVARSFRMAVAFHRGQNSLAIQPLKAEAL